MTDSLSTDEPIQVPPGREVELPGRGTMFVREHPGPPGAPTLFLLHAFAATGGINWFTAFQPLAGRFRIIAPDQRGHGRGLRTSARFRLEDCADDVAALAAELGIRSAIMGGYSMGGPISQLVWRRHRPLVQGLVLAATCYRFLHGAQARVLVSSVAGALAQVTRLAEVAAAVPLAGLRLLFPTQVQTSGSLGRWGAAEVRRHSMRAVLEAGMEIGWYNAEPWIGTVDVPTAVVLTSLDRAVPPIWQLRLARAIPGATLHTIAEGHVACGHALFGQVFAEAAFDVADRVAARAAGAIAPPADRVSA
jgi:pimeloyl-ACP methyl ester carboxylesterase